MSFLGTVGVVAQQGNQSVASSAPTNVSIATGSAGDYDNSFLTDDTNASFSSLTTDGENTKDDEDNNIIISSEGQSPYADEYGLGGGSTAYIKCYIRATDATTYTMTVNSLSSSMSNGCAITGAGAGWGQNFTSQDGTGSSGIGYVNIGHGGGRGNIVLPSHNDWFELSVSGSATNNIGTTNATTITGKFVFKDDS